MKIWFIWLHVTLSCSPLLSPPPTTYTHIHTYTLTFPHKVTLDNAGFTTNPGWMFCWVTILSGDHAYRVSHFGQASLLLRSTFWSIWSRCTQNTWTASSPDSPCLCSSQDYWLSLLYKRLIGPKVLAVHVAGLQRKPRPGRVIRDKLRIYAHCTNHHK